MWTSVSMPLKAAPVLLALTTLAFAILAVTPPPARRTIRPSRCA